MKERMKMISGSDIEDQKILKVDNYNSNNYLSKNSIITKERIKQIIKKNTANYQFTVIRLAREVGISYSYLYEKIYHHFNMSPQRLIETIRLEEAIRLIANGRKLIRLYKKVGYGNIRTFREAFFKRMHMNYTKCKSSLENCTFNDKEKVITKHVAHLWEIEDI